MCGYVYVVDPRIAYDLTCGSVCGKIRQDAFSVIYSSLLQRVAVSEGNFLAETQTCDHAIIRFGKMMRSGTA